MYLLFAFNVIPIGSILRYHGDGNSKEPILISYIIDYEIESKEVEDLLFEETYYTIIDYIINCKRKIHCIKNKMTEEQLHNPDMLREYGHYDIILPSEDLV